MKSNRNFEKIGKAKKPSWDCNRDPKRMFKSTNAHQKSKSNRAKWDSVMVD